MTGTERSGGGAARRAAQDALRVARLLLVIGRVAGPAAATALAHRLAGRRREGARVLYRVAPVLLARLGPTFVKVGQVLATRRDILPAELCDELSTLHDDVPATPSAGTAGALREAYGDDFRTLFTDVELTPVAAGSVACVHRATDRDGRVVALKIRRPGIDRLMARDLRLIRRGAALAARLPAFAGLPVTEIIGHLCDAVAGQVDFRAEADALNRLRRNLSGVARVWVPAVRQELCRDAVIAMEFIEDLDGAARAVAPVLRKKFAESALISIYQMLFVDGFVHCDLHPGNLNFTPRGQVVVLDAGFSVQLSDRLRRLFAEFFLNMAVGRGLRCAEIVVESAAGVGPDADVDGFLVRMTDLVRRNHGLPAREFSLMGFATEMFDLQRAHGVHAAPELIFPLLSLLVIEGTIRELHPGIDFQETAKPVINRGLWSATRP
ncbi:AarF/ABC1/UbiB kinase family protein [Amycolatopsis rhizosphaerae]|uniref:AarF/ABC1/UbiB kinase family protein n=1 Tax=Amycolatopsis rhizosphaerae TaxID=2053003 RepID=A0A558BKQ7_9PSEU|nr:AarF/UbiB family protein [Amycolatopsis rhizosphaerae]TVT37086.1 AarF/ABC1/UbiB kinase family protein [Amycolatopsis rhizosphaerae]